MGAFGPLGMIGAGANTLSGFFGGPTIADGINNVLSHPGAPTSVTGRGDNAPGGGSASQSYYQNMMSTSPAASSSSSSSSAAPAPASNDPYSDAMAAYLATMAADGTQSSSGTTSSSTLGVTNALQNNRISRAPLQPIYRPLEDPTVLRALGLVA